MNAAAAIPQPMRIGVDIGEVKSGEGEGEVEGEVVVVEGVVVEGVVGVGNSRWRGVGGRFSSSPTYA